MKKRLIALLLTAVLVFALLPATALAEPIKYPVRINGSRFSDMALTKTCGSGTATLNVTTTPYTLTLDNATITPYNDSSLMYGIYADTNLNIVLEGTNVINGGTATSAFACGIYMKDDCDLTISGEGSLTVTGGKPTGSETNSYGIRANALTIDASGGTVTTEGGAATNSHGIRVKGDMNISGGAVTAKGGAGGATYSYGILAQGALIVSGGSLNAHGYAAGRSNYGIRAETGELTVKNDAVVAATCDKATEGSSYAIYAKKLTLQGDELTATSGEAAEDSIGVFSIADMEISGGELIANGNTAANGSFGLRTLGSFSMTGGTVNAASGKATAGISYAIMAQTGFTMGDGAVTTASGEAADDSIGVYCPADITISGGELTANGCADGTLEDSYGVFAKGDVSVSAGIVTANGHAAAKSSYGLNTSGSLRVTGGTVNATSGAADVNSYAVVTSTSFAMENGVVNATGGQAAEDSGGVVCLTNMDISGGELNASALSSGTNYGIYAVKSMTISNGKVIANGNATAQNSYGIVADSLSLTGGETTASGNWRALSRLPGFGTADPTWYKWKVNTAASAPDGAYTRSRTAAYTRASADKYLSIVPDTSAAAIGDTTISGTVGTAMTPADITLTLTEEKFIALAADTDVGAWIADLPGGLSARLKDDVAAGAASAIITVSGTPASASAAPIAITIPANTLDSGSALPATENASAKWAIVANTSYTITYNSQGGSGTMSNGTVAIGEAFTLPGCGFAPPANGVFREWAIGSADSAVRVAPGASYTFSADTTVYAVWEAPTGDLGGTVKDGENKPVEGVTVTVFHGSNELRSTTTDEHGAFSFTGLYYGVYSLVGTKDTRTVTDIITVKQDSTNGDLILPAANKNTLVETAAGAPPVAATGLNEQYQNTAEDNDKGITSADNEVIDAGGSVELKLAAEAKVIEVDTDAEKINEELNSGETLALLVDLSVTKTVTTSEGKESETKLTELPALVEIYVELPVSLRGNTNLKVLRVHEGAVQALPYEGEYFTFTEDGIYLVLHVRRFSSYAIALKNEAPPVVPNPPIDHPDIDHTAPAEVYELSPFILVNGAEQAIIVPDMDIPQTADSATMAGWVMLAVAGLAGCAVLIKKKRRA